MCGIFGRLARDSIGDPSPYCAALATLTHRGPDDGAWWSDGPFFLGHRRLSIIDLSHGLQPMASEDGRYVVAFNGEIYNYLELCTTLTGMGYRFHTASDTEVLLHGYDAWGTELPRRLVGMFAFCLVDRREQTLFVARDRFGEKPLFIAEDDCGINFASELKALSALPKMPLAIDVEGLGGYLALNYVPGEHTLLRHIRRLSPASWRLYHPQRPHREGTYWSPSEHTLVAADFPFDEARERLLELLVRSVRITLRSDVPITLFLSGGIDSSLVAALAVRQGILRHAYCLDLPVPGYSELGNAQQVADRLGLELRRVVLGPESLEDFLELVGYADDPLADSSGLAVWTLARVVAQDYKVAISGDGGDELFAGYLTYPATRLHMEILARLPMPVRRALVLTASRLPVGTGKVSFAYKLQRFLRAADLPSAVAHFTWNGTWLPAEAESIAGSPAIAEAALAALSRICERHALPASPSLLDLQRVDIGDYLPNDILAKVDRMTMAHGLESRTPFLNPSIADFALALPASYKLPPGGPSKRILRELAVKLLGRKIATAKKQGFSIPVHQWLRGPARYLVEDLLSTQSLREIPILNGASIERFKNAHLKGSRQLGFELWGLMVLIAWYRMRVLGRDPATRLRPPNLRHLEFPASW
jgi:asparagine synthase (glutamine-hydrolysing)